MNCYAVNEADNGPVHRDYSQVYDPRRALTSRFFHSGFGEGGGGEGSRSPKGASILAITQGRAATGALYGRVYRL